MSDHWRHSTEGIDGMRGTAEDAASYAAGWTVSGLATPIPAQDSVEFRLYRGADCSASPILTRTDSTLTYNVGLTQGVADSGAPFDPPGPGTYRWRAFFSGDDNNAEVKLNASAPGNDTSYPRSLSDPTVTRLNGLAPELRYPVINSLRNTDSRQCEPAVPPPP